VGQGGGGEGDVKCGAGKAGSSPFNIGESPQRKEIIESIPIEKTMKEIVSRKERMFNQPN